MIGNVGQLFLGIAALVPVLAPIIRNVRVDTGPRGWAHCGVWAAVVAFAAAAAIILYGLAASDPVMTSAAIGRFRLLTIFIGLVAVSTGAWGAVTARPRGTAEANETLVLGTVGMLGGMIAMAAMVVIVLPVPAALWTRGPGPPPGFPGATLVAHPGKPYFPDGGDMKNPPASRNRSSVRVTGREPEARGVNDAPDHPPQTREHPSSSRLARIRPHATRHQPPADQPRRRSSAA